MGERCPEGGPTHRWGEVEVKMSPQIFIPYQRPLAISYCFLNIKAQKQWDHLHWPGRWLDPAYLS